MSHHKIFPLLLQGPFNLCVIILHISGWIHMNEISENSNLCMFKVMSMEWMSVVKKSVVSPAMFTFVQILSLIASSRKEFIGTRN